jgi:hypothetical protein
MNVKEIIEEWLKVHGYDGLCCENCGCIIGDLMPCGSDQSECKPGWKCITDTGDWFVIGDNDDPTT